MRASAAVQTAGTRVNVIRREMRARPCIARQDGQSAAPGAARANSGNCTVSGMAMKANWSERLRHQPLAVAALVVFAGSAATLLGAWYFQYVLKLPPCPLCLEERLPYYIVIPLSLLL